MTSSPCLLIQSVPTNRSLRNCVRHHLLTRFSLSLSVVRLNEQFCGAAKSRKRGEKGAGGEKGERRKGRGEERRGKRQEERDLLNLKEIEIEILSYILPRKID